MNNMTEKVIRDGNEIRKAKYNMISTVIGGILLLVGMMLFVIKGMSVEYVDVNGFLHENFFLIPLGFINIFCGLIVFGSIGIRFLVEKTRK